MNFGSSLRRAGLVIGLAAGTLHAQSAPSATAATWFTYGGEHAVSQRLLALVDVHVRRDGDLAGWRQLLLRGGLGWATTPTTRVAAGYAYMRSYANAELEVPATYPEHRLWQMAQLTHTVGLVTLTHRVRLEERWIGDADVAGGEGSSGTAVRTWRRTTRGRYQLRAAIPFPGTRDRVSLAASEELFASSAGGATAADQNRFAVTLGTRVAPTLRMEVGYLNRAAIADGTTRVRDHALLVSFTSTAPLRRAR